MLRKNLLNSKVLKPSSVEPAKQWPRGSSQVEGGRGGGWDGFVKWSIVEYFCFSAFIDFF